MVRGFLKYFFGSEQRNNSKGDDATTSDDTESVATVSTLATTVTQPPSQVLQQTLMFTVPEKQSDATKTFTAMMLETSDMLPTVKPPKVVKPFFSEDGSTCPLCDRNVCTQHTNGVVLPNHNLQELTKQDNTRPRAHTQALRMAIDLRPQSESRRTTVGSAPQTSPPLPPQPPQPPVP